MTAQIAVVGAGLRSPFDGESHQVNPTCGDEVTLRVSLDDAQSGKQVVRDVSYEAVGCSISVASASVLAEELTGADLDTVDTTCRAMHAMLTSRV